MVRFSKSQMSRLFFKIQLMVALFKISNLIMLRRQKLQLVIILFYAPTKLLKHPWTMMEETPKENTTTAYGCDTEHVEENSDNGNYKQSDDGNSKHFNNYNKNDILIFLYRSRFFN